MSKIAANAGQKATRSKRLQRGFDLIQLMIVVGIIGLLLAGVMYIAQTMQMDASTENEVNYTKSTITNVRRGRSTSADMSTITTAWAITQRRVADRWVSGATLLNSWNGMAITIAGNASGKVVITQTGVPKDACVNYVNGVQSMASDITVGGSVAKTNGGTYSVTATETGCSAGGDTVNIALSFS